MLNFYAFIARRLVGVQWLLWTFVLITGALLVASLLLSTHAQAEHYTLIALCALLWSISLVVLVRVFAVPTPVVDRQAGLLERAKVSLRHGARWVMAVVVSVLLVSVLVISIRAIGIVS